MVVLSYAEASVSHKVKLIEGKHTHMPELNGYKTLDLVMQELGIGEPKVRQAIAALAITPTVFNFDKRSKYYSREDVERMRDWLKNH